MVCIPRAALAQALESARIRKVRILPLSGVRETNRFRDQRDSSQIVHMASPTFRGELRQMTTFIFMTECNAFGEL